MGEKKVKCLECGEYFEMISNSHLKYKHQMTMEEYKAKYNLSKLDTVSDAFRIKCSKVSDYEVIGKDEILPRLRKYFNEHQDVGSFLYNNKRSFYHLVERHFGSIRNALDLLEIDHHNKLSRNRIDEEDLLLNIKTLYDQNFPLSAKYIEKVNPKFYSNCCKKFGSWRNGLLEAGVPAEIVNSVVKRGLRENYFLRMLDNEIFMNGEISKRNEYISIYYYGSLKKALNTLEEKYAELKWPKRKIIEHLSNIYTKDLSHPDLQKGTEFRYAILNNFKSIKAALNYIKYLDTFQKIS